MPDSNDSATTQLEAVLLPVFEHASVELVELTLRQEGGQRVLRCLVDTPDGITAQQCARLNRTLGEHLEAQDAIAEEYVLEVCSPGLDRPLKTARDFERAWGAAVSVEVADGTMAEGTVRGLRDGQVVLKVEDADDVLIALADIKTAKKVIQW